MYLATYLPMREQVKAEEIACRLSNATNEPFIIDYIQSEKAVIFRSAHSQRKVTIECFDLQKLNTETLTKIALNAVNRKGA